MGEGKFLKTLSNIQDLLNSSYELDVSMKVILSEINNFFADASSGIYYISEDVAYLKSTINETSSLVDDFSISDNLKDKIYSENFIELGQSEIKEIKRNLKAKNQDLTILILPLKIRMTVFGFVLVCTKDNTLSETEKECLVTLSNVAAYAIKDAELSNVFKIQLKSLQTSIIDKTEAYKTIKEQNKKIVEANKIKNDFIANISHELRTPLNAIIGLSEVLSSKVFGELNSKQNEYIDDIYTSGVHLLSMINEILDISKIEANAIKINYSEFLPQQAVQEVINIMNPLAKKKNIELKFNCKYTETINSDYQKIQQMMYNLVSNAIKFTPKDGNIEIKIESKKGKLFISVKDSGIGIKKEEQDKIFDKFVQLGNVYTKTTSSTGLGLTITKKFVELLNGSIEVESQINVGTVFTINLPLDN